MTREEFISGCELILKSPPFNWPTIAAVQYSYGLAKDYFDVPEEDSCLPADAIEEDKQYWDD